MTKKKKTRKGVDISSTRGAQAKEKNVWWLAVLQNRHVQIFSYEWPDKKLNCLIDFIQPRYHDLISQRLRDSQGRSFDSFSWSKGGHQTAGPRHSLTSRTTPQERISELMVRKVATFLEEGRRKKGFDHLGIFADPHLLGRLRTHLKASTHRLIALEVDSNLAWLKKAELQKKILSYLPRIAVPERIYPRAQGVWQVPKLDTKERKRV